MRRSPCASPLASPRLCKRAGRLERELREPATANVPLPAPLTCHMTMWECSRRSPTCQERRWPVGAPLPARLRPGVVGPAHCGPGGDWPAAYPRAAEENSNRGNTTRTFSWAWPCSAANKAGCWASSWSPSIQTDTRLSLGASLTGVSPVPLSRSVSAGNPGIGCLAQRGDQDGPAHVPGCELLEPRKAIQRQAAMATPANRRRKLTPRKSHFNAVNTGASASTTAVCSG